MAKLPDSVFYPIGSKIFKNSDEYADNTAPLFVFYKALDNSDIKYEEITSADSRASIYSKAEADSCPVYEGGPSISGTCPSGYTLCEEARSPFYGSCLKDDGSLSCEAVTTATPTPTPTPTPTSGGSTPTPSMEVSPTPTSSASTPTPSA